ncbi:MAG: T9SS type A sorting domain-containing protein [Bacteroidales bacterium]|nr:T9SS type A sorting domain-containing protein [Bacteroidales bacterium]MDD4214415.1 T9SS type A sorting domain-containing protein [Bacteroidales bacterium]
MKKSLLFIIMLSVAIYTSGQALPKKALAPVPKSDVLHKTLTGKSLNAAKTLTCIDTLRYPQLKEIILGDTSWWSFTMWTADQEAMLQAFLLSGASMNVTGVEFYGRREPSSSANLIVETSIWNVDVNNNPTTQIGTVATITITDTNFNFRQINFTPAIAVSGNYAVVIRPTSTNGILEFFLNDGTPSQSYDEGLSKYKSSYYAPSSGAWVSMPILTAGFTGGPFDNEMLAAPTINYSINSDFTITPPSACVETPVDFTGAPAPATILGNRMFNYNAFLSYFLSEPDSTYVYDPDPASPTAPFLWGINTSYTYTVPNTYLPRLYTLGGFWASCLDFKEKTIIIDACTAIEESMNGNINITPNPAHDRLFITLPEKTENYSITIFSANGKVVMSETNTATSGQISIDISSFVKGFYFLQITLTSDTYCEKIIIE